MKDNTNVKNMFPVKLELNGKNGINPIKLLIQIKKNIVNKYGIYLAYFFSPILGIAISSLTKVTSGSIKPAKPFGALLFFL